MKKADNYYFGADLGTDSLGWAVTDFDYNPLRLKGKTAWGSHIFESAEGKKKRGLFRRNNRRMQRRKYRLELLNGLFAKELEKIDSTFLIRLDNSTYVYEDKLVKGLSKTLLFKTPEEEKQFYKDYPTIWHLRNDLYCNKEDSLRNLKNVYLAIHHIMKYRGNFIREGQTINLKKIDNSVFVTLNETLKYLAQDEEEFDIDYLPHDSYEKIVQILDDPESGKKEKQKEIKSKFINVDSEEISRYISLFIALVTDGTIAAKKVIPDKVDDEKTKFELGKTYDEKQDDYRNLLGEAFPIVEIAKQISDFISVKKLLKDYENLSRAMVDCYDTHKSDLKLVKRILIDIDTAKGYKGTDREYYKVFKDKKNPNNYCSFVKKDEVKKTKDTLKLSVLPDSVNKMVLDIITKYKDIINEDDYEYLLRKTSDNKLFIKPANLSTSAIPHQLHLAELKTIIDNASLYHPFLKDIKEKLIQLFLFRIPYTWGPLDTRSEHAWVIRKDGFKKNITPWNYEEIVDEEKSAEEFMRRLTNKCTYLHYENVLPNSSIYYEEYMILDRLNALRINGNALSKDMKDKAFVYISSRSKTTVKQLEKFFEKQYAESFKDEKAIISGIDTKAEFKSNSKAFMSKLFDLNDIEKIETIIYLATVYVDSKPMLEKALRKMNISEDKIKMIKDRFFTTKWARFSKKLLCGLKTIDDNEVAYSILDLLKTTGQNFQQIINNERYGFMDLIREENDLVSGDYSEKERIEEILETTSPKNRRGVYRLLAVLDDIVKITKKAPEKIFLEVTRENLTDAAKKKATKDSRYKELEDFLKETKKSDKKNEKVSQIEAVTEELQRFSNDSERTKLKGKHLYLYFKQLGFDLYTGKKININDVIASDKYDIDHIIPRSLKKDDSLDNLVLVDKNYNQSKKNDVFPIPFSIKTAEVMSLWKYLFDHNAISEEKYGRLIRTAPLSYDEINDFVNSQINVLNSANIIIRDILKIKYPESKVVFSKAQYPSEIRRKLGIAKNRDLNDAHHAVDAYLNIVSGNILSTTYSNVRKIYHEKVLEHKSNRSFEMSKVLLGNLVKEGNLTELGKKVFNTCLRRDAIVTYKVDYISGEFYKETIFGRNSGFKDLIPTHTKEDSPFRNSSVYGGYNELKNDYLYFAEVTEKGKIKRKFLTTKYLHNTLLKGQELITKIKNENEISDDASIKLIKKVYVGQKIFLNGLFFLIATKGYSLNLKQSYQIYLNNDTLLYLAACNKKLEIMDSCIDELIINKAHRNKDHSATDDVELVVSKDKNLSIMNNLIEIAKMEKYNPISFIRKFRTFDLQKYGELTLKNQVLTINESIKLFTRKAEKSSVESTVPFCEIKTKRYTLTNNTDYSNDNLQIIYESPTGLFSKKVKL